MAIQLVRDQLIDSIINVNKIDNSAVSFVKLDGADIETSLAGGVSKLATAAAIKTYVDGQLPDQFSGGNGIQIDASGDPDVINVDLATNPGMQFTSAKLDLKLKSESGGSLTKDANGLYIADSAISNAKLATSTISGIALGANLADLTAGNGLSMSAYNGGTARVIDMSLDGATLSKSNAGLKVADLQIGTQQLSNSSVTAEKMAIFPTVDALTPNGILTQFDLTKTMSVGYTSCLVFRNGVALEQVASSPSGTDQYVINRTAGTGGKSQIEFGSAVSNGESLRVFYIA